MKVILFADGQVGQSILKFISKNYPGDISMVVTTEKNDIYHFATNEGLRCLSLESVSDHGGIGKCLEKQSLDFDLGILAWWPHILDKETISMAVHGFINLHPTLLPYGRGKHGSFWAIVEGKPFGATIHMVTPEIDTGDIIYQKIIDYDWCATGGSLYKKAIEELLILFYENYKDIRVLNFDTRPQGDIIRNFHKAKEMDKMIDIDLGKRYRARDLLNVLRAKTFTSGGYGSCRFRDDGVDYEITVDIKRLERDR